MSFEFGKMVKFAFYFKQGVIYTILLSACTVAIGFVLALVNKPGRSVLSRVVNKVLHVITGVYIDVIRGTPMLVQLYIVYYILFGDGGLTAPKFMLFGFISGEQFIPGIIALSLNSGAYVAEIVRGGIQGIDYGQTEACRSLGMTKLQNMRYIVLPQAIKNILPAIANEFVTIIKESAIVWTIGVADIMAAVNAVKGGTYIIMEPLLVATAIYFCLCFPTSKLIAYAERRMRRGDVR